LLTPQDKDAYGDYLLSVLLTELDLRL